MKLSQVATNATHRILIYGPPKCGKTKLVGELAKEFKLLWFDLENGWVTLTTLPSEYQENIELIRIPDTRSFPVGVETMLKVIKGGPVDICEEHGKVTCMLCKKDSKPTIRVCLNEMQEDTVLVIDSLTQFTNSAIANITKDKPDDYKLQHDDWGNLGKLCDILLSHIQQAKFNVVCITHETEAEMEDGKNKLVPTAGTRNFSRNTAKYFDHVIYAEVKNRKHTFGSSTTYGINMVTGSRTDIVLEKMEAPSLLDIFKGRVRKVAPAVSNNPDAPTVTNAVEESGKVAVDRMAILRAKLAAQKAESSEGK
jgi:hypothetical protein